MSAREAPSALDGQLDDALRELADIKSYYNHDDTPKTGRTTSSARSGVGLPSIDPPSYAEAADTRVDGGGSARDEESRHAVADAVMKKLCVRDWLYEPCGARRPTFRRGQESRRPVAA